MLAQTLVVLLGAAAASANSVQTLMTRSDNLFTRQLSAANIPSACQSGCASTITIYQACTTGDLTTCTSVCQSSNYASFTGCLQCIVNNAPGASASDVDQLNQALSGLNDLCNQAGTPVSTTTLAVQSGASASGGSASGASASGAVINPSASGGLASSISSGVMSMTSQASGGLASQGASASSAVSGAGASLSSAIARLSTSMTSGTTSRTSSPASSTSNAAGQAMAIALPGAQKGVVAGLVGLVGLAVGAVMVF